MNEEVKEYLQPGKKNIILIYVLYLSGLLVPILPFVGGAFAYAGISHPNKVWQSHYVFAFKTFYICAACFLIVRIVNFAWVGPVIYVIILVWFVMRSIISLQFLFKGMAHPNPLTFWIK